MTTSQKVKVVCSRCWGSGKYSFTPMYGSMCFGCSGKGYTGWTTQAALDAEAAKKAKGKAAYAKRKAKKLAKAKAEAEQFLVENPELAAAFEVNHHIINDICHKLHRYGSISEKQAAFVLKLAKEKLAKLAQQAEWDALKTDLDAGRYEMTGTIVSLKSVEGDWGWTTKMLVRLDGPEGNAVYGTRPSSLREAEKGDHIVFTAKVEPKETGFGFFSRPSKAKAA